MQLGRRVDRARLRAQGPACEIVAGAPVRLTDSREAKKEQRFDVR
jgi:hypothetical protein